MLSEGVFIAIECGCLLLVVENCMVSEKDMVDSQDMVGSKKLGVGLGDTNGQVHLADLLLYLGQKALGRKTFKASLAANVLSSLLAKLATLFETHSQCDARWTTDNYLSVGRRLRGRGHKMSSSC